MEKIYCITVGNIQTNCWLYALEDTPEAGDAPGRSAPEHRSADHQSVPCAIIDPGDEAALIVSRLRELNWIPRLILLTHGHFDHLAALPDLLLSIGKMFSNEKTEAFEKGVSGFIALPKTGVHRLDARYLGKDALTHHRASLEAIGGDPAFIDAMLPKPLSEPDLVLEEGDIAGPFKVLHVPGHTPGSVCFYDEKNNVLFSGDTLFRGDCGRTDLPGGDRDQLRQSLKRLLSMKGETIVCPGHGPATTIAHEHAAAALL